MRPNVWPKKGQKWDAEKGVWYFPAETIPDGKPTTTTTDAPASYTYTHHDIIHPRKGMTPYERRNWLNARAGWPVKGHVNG